MLSLKRVSLARTVARATQEAAKSDLGRAVRERGGGRAVLAVLLKLALVAKSKKE